MATKANLEAQNPLILRCNRLMEAFAKSDEERDFYLDRLEGFIVYADLDKSEDDLKLLEKELEKAPERYCMIPKLTFYETKKIMEGFVNEKVYDIDTKEKLLDIIQSKEARENFLEFIYDHHSELEKWQSYYQERSRIRIIEWLRNNHFHFVFEEDLDLPKSMLEKLKRELFQTKAGKDILNARKVLSAKAKSYYSNEALNPRPKRGRPPKQTQKLEVEHQITTDIYTTVPSNLRSFLFTPDLSSPSSATFSAKFGNEEELLASRGRLSSIADADFTLENINQKLATLRSLSSKWIEGEASKKNVVKEPKVEIEDFDDETEEEEDLEEEVVYDVDEEENESVLNGYKKNPQPKKVKPAVALRATQKAKVNVPPKKAKAASPKIQKPAKPKTPLKKAAPAAKVSKKKTPLRPIMKLKSLPKKKAIKSPVKKAKPVVKKKRK